MKISISMLKHFKFSESDFWRKAVINTYKLYTKDVILAGEKITLYKTTEYSNSPYITDGGNMANLRINKVDFEGIKDVILLKFRSKLSLSKEIPHILIEDYVTYTLDISGGLDDIWNNKVKSKTRNQVRKAEKSNYQVKIGGVELLKDFYSIISKAWLDLGTPTHSSRFYKNIIIQAEQSSEYNAKFIILYIDNKPASASILIYDDYSLHHPYAATLKKYNYLSLNNGLYWEIIKFAVSQNLKVFDLGRSKRTQTTATYKKSWGAAEVQLYYYYINTTTHRNEEDNKFVQLMVKLWKKLPLNFANFLGPSLIKNILK